MPPTLTDSGWRSLSTYANAAPADLCALQRAVEQLWLEHPLVGQIVTVLCDFTIGEGLTVLAEGREAQRLTEALIAAQPSWEGLQRAVATHLAVYGEVFLVLSDPQAGDATDLDENASERLPRIELIPPPEVIACCQDESGTLTGIVREYLRTDPVDLARLARDPGLALRQTIGRTERVFTSAAQIVHVAGQAGAAGLRGRPPLARIVPWVERYDQWLLDRVRINRTRGSFAFLRKVPSWGLPPAESYGEAPIDGWRHGKAGLPVPKPGSVLVVNEQESWEVLAPEVGADDASADGRALKLMILAGAGLAEHYVGDLAQSNLATARAAELPMLKRFEADQRRVLEVFHALITRVLQSRGIDAAVRLTLPAPGLTDGLELTQTLGRQLELGLISKETARGQIPWVSDVHAEAARIAQEEGERS